MMVGSWKIDPAREPGAEKHNDAKMRTGAALSKKRAGRGKDDLWHPGSLQHESAFEYEHGRPADDDAVASILTDESAAAARHLMGNKPLLAEPPRPIRDQRTMGDTRHRIFGHAVCRGKESRDKIARVGVSARRRDDHRRAIQCCKSIHAR